VQTPLSRRLLSFSVPLCLLGAAAPGFLASCSMESGDDQPGDGGDGPDGSGDGKQDGNGGGGPDGSGGGGPDGSGGGPDGSGAGDPDGSSDGLDATFLPIDARPPPDATPIDPPPDVRDAEFLSEAGLYSDIASHTVLAGIREFEPEFKLWSDGAEKQRWIRLPPGAQINTIDMASWRVPLGTIVYKEFADPVSGKRLETRVIQRLPDGTGFYFGSFVWNEDDTEAVLDLTPNSSDPVDIPDGCAECDSPPCTGFPGACHVVPQRGRCNECHGGETGRLLGFSAVQLSHGGPGLTLTLLAQEGLLTNPPPAGMTYPVPGTPVERAAIGSLHANCGHCHAPSASQNNCFSLTNPGGAGGMQARVLPTDDSVEDTQIYRFAVDQPLRYWIGRDEGNHTESQTGELITDRIVPGEASRSAVWYRMSVREWGEVLPYNDHQQMPPIATNEVDEDGLAAVELWINSLQ